MRSAVPSTERGWKPRGVRRSHPPVLTTYLVPFSCAHTVCALAVLAKGCSSTVHHGRKVSLHFLVSQKIGIPSGIPPAQKVGSSGPGSWMVRSVAFCCSVVKCFGDSLFEDRRVKHHGIYEIRANMNANSFENLPKNNSKSMKHRRKFVSRGVLGTSWGVSAAS